MNRIIIAAIIVFALVKGADAMYKTREEPKTIRYLACDYCDANIVKGAFVSISKECFVPARIPCPDGMEGCLVLHWADEDARGSSEDLFVFCDMGHLKEYIYKTKEEKE